jgi:hypothetical protein
MKILVTYERYRPSQVSACARFGHWYIVELGKDKEEARRLLLEKVAYARQKSSIEMEEIEI